MRRNACLIVLAVSTQFASAQLAGASYRARSVQTDANTVSAPEWSARAYSRFFDLENEVRAYLIYPDGTRERMNYDPPYPGEFGEWALDYGPASSLAEIENLVPVGPYGIEIHESNGSTRTLQFDNQGPLMPGQTPRLIAQHYRLLQDWDGQSELILRLADAFIADPDAVSSGIGVVGRNVNDVQMFGDEFWFGMGSQAQLASDRIRLSPSQFLSPGETYEIRISFHNADSEWNRIGVSGVVSTSVFVTLVPAPSGSAILGLGVVLAARRRRG